MSSPISNLSNQEIIVKNEHDDSSASHLPPRKRARTEAEKEQRRVERIIRNRKAAHASREKKRKHVEQLESYVKLLELNLSNSIKLNNSMVSKLNSNNIKLDDDIQSVLISIEKLNRPNGLVLSDEDESSASTPNDNEQEQDIEEEEEERDNSIVKDSDVPLLSSSSPSSSVSASEFSNPSTPISEDVNDFFTIDDSKSHDFNLMITNPAAFMDLNTYLEPEFSSSDSNNDLVDHQSLVFKSTTNSSNNDNLMGYLGSYNSVHSAVMHIPSLSSSFLF